jgi:hypothetical protein
VGLGGLHLLIGNHKQWGPPAKTVSKPYLMCFDIGLPTEITIFVGTILCKNKLATSEKWSPTKVYFQKI